MNQKNLEEEQKSKESKIFIMFLSSLLLLVMSIGIIYSSLLVKEKFTFKFADNVIFIETKGAEIYNIDLLRDKLSFLFLGKDKTELDLFIEKIVEDKSIEDTRNTIKEMYSNESLFKKEIIIIDIVKIYGSNMKIKGNKKVYQQTNGKYKVSLLLKNTEKQEVKKRYLTMFVVVNAEQKISSISYSKNENLKEFYEAINFSKFLSLENLGNLIQLKLKNKILIRNILIKPLGTTFIVHKTVYENGQIQILVNIDNKEYALIYKKGEIINVIKLFKK